MWTWRSTAAPGSPSRLNGAGKTTLLRILGRPAWRPTPARCGRGTACGWATTPRSTNARRRPDDPRAHAQRRGPTRPTPTCARSSAPSSSPATTSTSRPGALRRREDPAGAGHPGLLGGERAAARRADQQPRPGQPGTGAGRDRQLPGGESCWSRTTPARCRRSSRTGRSCCRTATRTRERRPSGVGRARLKRSLSVAVIDNHGDRQLSTGAHTDSATFGRPRSGPGAASVTPDRPAAGRCAPHRRSVMSRGGAPSIECFRR